MKKLKLIKRYLLNDDDASVNPVIIFFIVLAVTSLLVLLLGHVLEPFFNLMGFDDSDIKDSISAPRKNMFNLGQIIWPYGVMLAVFTASIFGLLMEYQKSKYQRG